MLNELQSKFESRAVQAKSKEELNEELDEIEVLIEKLRTVKSRSTKRKLLA